jgi:hypothetical protein
MPTDDETTPAGDAGGGTPHASATDEDVEEAVAGTENRRVRVQDDPGSADEWFARGILITPFVILLVGATAVGVLVWSGQIALDVTLNGSISIGPLVYGFAGLVGVVYVLAAAKEWGIAPVKWVAGAARDYRPNDRE